MNYDRFFARNPRRGRSLLNRALPSRRAVLELAGAGVAATFFTPRARAAESMSEVTTINKAKNVIFLMLTGAPSHTDTFDFKMVDGVTPAAFAPETINGVVWPVGLMPRTAGVLADVAIVRSVRAWALVHSLAQTWTQIGRNPAAALGDIAPNMGAVVAREKAAERQSTQVFPPFLGLNAQDMAGPGYFAAQYAPFKYNPTAAGLPDTTNPDGQARLDQRLGQLSAVDGALRATPSPLGGAVSDMAQFYDSARSLMYNAAVDRAFRFAADDSARYGSSPFGNACLVAKQVLAENQGTRYIQVNFGGWDMHDDIYSDGNPRNIQTLGGQFDQAYAALLGDLKSSGLLAETLVVAAGEFGRTVGALSAQDGRDHFVQQSILFAGAGVKGGRAIGKTNASGSDTVEFGWSRDRYVRAEDVEATIYSAAGINWTKISYDDPFGRGFEYVPYAADDVYGPVTELWS